jgi:type IV pilus assembly protein PilV
VNTKGFTLVEVLVALVVMTVGMLGIAALYVEGLRLSRTSIYRMNAINLASDMADRIRTNFAVPASYAGNGPGANNNCVNSAVNCTPDQLAADDWFRWLETINNRMPPGTTGVVDVSLAGPVPQYDVTVTWPETGRTDPVSHTLVLRR